MNRFFITSLIALIAYASSFAVSLNSTAGKLADLLTDEVRQATTLDLSGTMNARDFATINEELTNLTSLNLQDIKIEAYSSKKAILGNSSTFEADVLPQNAFFGMQLTEIILPSSLIAIDNGAFTNSKIKNIDIPAGVVKIGSFAFADCDNLQSISFPSSVSVLGDYLTSDCDNLIAIDLKSSGITELPAYAFFNCMALSSVVLPDNLTTIHDGCFSATSTLQSIILPSTLKKIGNKAFQNSGIENIFIPKNVELIGDFAFANCNNLITADISAENPIIGKGIFFYCSKLSSLTFNRQIIISDYSYAGTSSLNLNETDLSNVQSIGKYAFVDNQSEKIEFGNELQMLDDHAMEGMNALTEIIVSNLGDNVPQLGEDVFLGINQPNVQLTIADDTEDAWKSAEQWKEFDIKSKSDLVGVEMLKETTKAWFDENMLCIASSNLMETISIFTTNGLCVAQLNCNNTTASFDTSALHDTTYIVIVTTNNNICSFKLTR